MLSVKCGFAVIAFSLLWALGEGWQVWVQGMSQGTESCTQRLLLVFVIRGASWAVHLARCWSVPALSLTGLNMLQSGLHKQHMKDLFVELCLTVPVRLSSLLPYLPMLMDPLVSALNGSQTLVSQGLRTLELCVDNLQPDFLYDHIQPVRAELMQVSVLTPQCLQGAPDAFLFFS